MSFDASQFCLSEELFSFFLHPRLLLNRREISTVDKPVPILHALDTYFLKRKKGTTTHIVNWIKK